MDDNDTVATALEDIDSGDEIGVYNDSNELAGTLCALTDAAFGCKVALSDIAAGDKVFKYGAVIGECVRAVKKGELVHVHNLKSLTVDIPCAIKKEIMRQMNISVAEES